MLLSKSCEYGLRAALFLASKKERSYISIRKMSDKLNISHHFLTKVLQQLTRAGLMESYKGPNGGIRLARKGDNIQLFEVVTAIDGSDLFNECILGLPGCGDDRPCAMHNKWATHRKDIKEMLKSTTLDRLSRESRSSNFRVTLNKGLDEL